MTDSDLDFTAGRQRRQKPQEPNRMVLAVGVGAVVLAGLLGVWFLRGGDDANEASESDPASVTSTTPTDTAMEDEGFEDPDATAPFVGTPTLAFDAAASGPLMPNTPYDIALSGAPEGAMLQVVVNGDRQAEPNPALPRLEFPPGRHSMYVEITTSEGLVTSDQVEFFVLGGYPDAGWRVNLKSVDQINEGWVEAITQFDTFRGSGHEELNLIPLTEGFWNLLVGGFGEDEQAAKNYCESFQLAIPDQCFTTYFDPSTAPVLPEKTSADATADPSTDSMEDPTATTAPFVDPDGPNEGEGDEGFIDPDGPNEGQDPDAMTDTTAAGG